MLQENASGEIEEAADVISHGHEVNVLPLPGLDVAQQTEDFPFSSRGLPYFSISQDSSQAMTMEDMHFPDVS